MERMPESDAMQWVRRIRYRYSAHWHRPLLVEMDSRVRHDIEWALASRESLRYRDVGAGCYKCGRHGLQW